jgi:hypothetical protein
VEDVVRVVAPLQRGEPGELILRVRPADAALTLIGKHVDVDAACVRLNGGAEPAGCVDVSAVLSRIGSACGGDELDQGVAVAEGAVVVRRRRDRTAVTLQGAVRQP